jgi:ribonuclease J
MEICTVGGFEEVGKNMTAVKIKDDVIIFDAGLHLPSVIELQEQEATHQNYTERKLRDVGAIPDDLVLDKLQWRNKVRAIIISHAHLDHVGGVPYIAKRYPQAEIIGTQFTIAVLESLLEDSKIKLKNRIKIVKPDSTHIIKGKSGDYKIDFVHTTHSTLQCIFPALHTQEGVFFYAEDLKFDNYPTLGNPPNYNKLRQLGKKGVKAVVIDALYSGTEKKPGGEKVAKHLLQEAFSLTRNKNAALFITTFSSHIERLKNIVEMGRKTNRKIIFLGRSLNKYINAAIKTKQCSFTRNITLVKYKNQINSTLKRIEKERGRYLVVCTGHQAESGSILDRISKGETPFRFRKGDQLIFSSSVIPAPANILSRSRMDKKLRNIGVKIQTDIHVHGHGSREDMRVLIDALKPQHVIPGHGELEKEAPFIELANEYGYKFGITSHLTSDGKLLKI